MQIDLTPKRQLRCLIAGVSILLAPILKAWASLEAISVNEAHYWGNANSVNAVSSSAVASVSADGRYVVFDSGSDNLVPNDTNIASDVFLRDRFLETTRRISIAQDGTQANNHSFAYAQSISQEGRYIVFSSLADNLLGSLALTPNNENIFLYDTQKGQTTLVSRPLGFPLVQTDGGTSEHSAAISADGQWVVFSSSASNLVVGDTNKRSDVFLFHIKSGTISRISVSSTSTEGNGDSNSPSINEDGTKIAFFSEATNLVPGDTNGKADIFLREITQGTTVRVSVSNMGGQLNGQSDTPSIDGAGCRISFHSYATNAISGQVLQMGHTYLRDVCQGTTSWISQNFKGDDTPFAGDITNAPAVSGNGQCVVFSARGPNLSRLGDTLPDFPNIYLRNLQDGTIRLLSIEDDGTAASLGGVRPFVNKECSLVTFVSGSSNLIPGLPWEKNEVVAYSPTRPTSEFTYTLTEEIRTIHFDSHLSDVLEGTILAYQWDFGDKTSSTEPNPTHTYSTPGTYWARLTIIDDHYIHATTKKKIIFPANQLGGGGFGCSIRGSGSQGFGFAGLSVLICGIFLFIARRFCFRSKQ